METLSIEVLALPSELLPSRLPQGWKLFQPLCTEYQAAWKGPKGMGVIMSVTRESDGLRWLHVSLSSRSEEESYRNLKMLKRIWIGPAAKAIQVLPPSSEHINIHPHCLHLFHCLDRDPLPDFTRGLGVI